MHIDLPVMKKNKPYTINPTKIIALGLNYRDHIAESEKIKVQGFNKEIPSEPILFPKTPNVLIGTEEPIIIPRFIKKYKFDEPRIDYEAELALIIKDKCKYISRENAFDHILGYTCMNDVSMRNFQRSDKAGWFRGKSLDTFGPIGPVIVPHELIGDPQNLNIKCLLNGRTVQDSNTKYMIFKIPEIIEFVTSNFTLEKGDIIMTGTPSGVGPVKNNDIVEIEIENIGTLRNRVVEE